MTKTNYDVAYDFVAGKQSSHNRSMECSGDRLYSYATVIARRISSNTYLVSDNNFSPTTSKHLGELAYALRNKNAKVYYVPDLNFGSELMNSFEFLSKKFIKNVMYYVDNKAILTRKPNRLAFRHAWKIAQEFDKDVFKFIDSKLSIKVNRLLNTIKQD